jgi:hypothetical protein
MSLKHIYFTPFACASTWPWKDFLKKFTILTIGELLEPYENIRKYIRKKGGGRERWGEGNFFKKMIMWTTPTNAPSIGNQLWLHLSSIHTYVIPRFHLGKLSYKPSYSPLYTISPSHYLKGHTTYLCKWVSVIDK